MIHMETGGSKTTPSPKAIIFQKFGSNASYEVEEVQEPAESGCPGLAISQKGPCLYRCILQLPGISVISGTFKKKKEAEQSASEMAIEKVWSIHFSTIIFIISLAGQLYLHTLKRKYAIYCGARCAAFHIWLMFHSLLFFQLSIYLFVKVSFLFFKFGGLFTCKLLSLNVILLWMRVYFSHLILF